METMIDDVCEREKRGERMWIVMCNYFYRPWLTIFSVLIFLYFDMANDIVLTSQ